MPVIRIAHACRLTLAALALGTAACVGPGQATPLNPDSLRGAHVYSASRRGTAVLVSHHGKIVFEQYANGGARDKPQKIYSGTKSFWTFATLVAAEEGLLRLDEPASKTISEWRNDRQRKDITIRQLMNFTSGLDPAFSLHSSRVPDRNARALRVPMIAAPGKAFTYGPSHGQVLCEVLRRKLAPRSESPTWFLRRKVLTPLAISEVDFRADRRGNPLLASGFRLTARQWARFGALLLDHGKPILNEQSFRQLLNGSRANPAFGLGLWLNSGASGRGARERDIEEMLELPWQRQDWRNACLCRDAPADMFAAIGSGYQRLFVIPSRDLVIVRQGSDAAFSDAEFLRKLLKP